MTNLLNAQLKTTLIGAYPKPHYVSLPTWFDHNNLGLSRPSIAYDNYLNNHKKQEPILDKATQEVVQEQISLGINIPTDGEVRRENYIYYHCRHLRGIDFKTLTKKHMRKGAWIAHVPTITHKIKAEKSFLVRDYAIAQAASKHPIKMAVPGPMTIMDSIADNYYFDQKKLGYDLAIALNKEICALAHAGCRWIQIDEPLFARYPKHAIEYGIELLNMCVRTLPSTVTTVVHICCGYPSYLNQLDYLKANPHAYKMLAPALDASDINAISLENAHTRNDPALFSLFKNKTVILGVLNISSSRIETVEEIIDHIHSISPYINQERLIIAPDCGLGMLPKKIMLEKLHNMVQASLAITP